MTTTRTTTEQFAEQVITEIGTVYAAATMYVGHKSGLYDALASSGWTTAAELATATGMHERYLQEWLNAQAAGGYVEYDAQRRSYRLPEEHGAVLVDRDSSAYLAGAVDGLAAVWAAVDRVAGDFRTGQGLPWGEHDPRLFTGTEEFFRPGYEAYLTSEWIPALQGVEAKLLTGGRVADVGCGHGVSTVTMATAYPRSTFVGFDSHPASVETAKKRAADAGVGDRARFEVAPAANLTGTGYDLICFFDCLHDMGDPVDALQQALEALAVGGSVMLIEPNAGDRVEENLNPIGRLYYSASTLVCTANGIAQGATDVLGAQAGEQRLRAVAQEAGFTRVDRVADSPFNLVLQLRP